MKITLGTGIGSSHFRGRNAFDELACSPAVFLEVMEQRLGLTGKLPSHGQRIANYRNALDQRLHSGDAFYHESFKRDPYAVAETLLGWRDALYMDGWEVDEVEFGSERLDCLRQVETYFDPACKCSEGERIRRVLRQITTSDPGIESLRVVDPEEWLPLVWREFLSRMQAEFHPPAIEPFADTDLGRFQQALLKNQTTFEFKGDGSIEFVTAYSEAVLANAAAQRIAKAGDSSAVVDGENLHLVDAALQRLDLPGFGASTKSRSRPIPQLLNLVLQLQWRPFNPQRLLDFLVHPESPVNFRLRNRLSAALIDEPGVGGEAWNQAVEKTRAACNDRYADEPEELAKSLKRIDDDLGDWLSPPTLNPTKADSEQLAKVAEQLGRWANKRARNGDQEASMLAHLHALSKEFAEIIREQTTVTQAGVERLLRQLTGSGVSAADGPAELGHAPVWSVAGYVEPVDTVLWWNFAEPGTSPAHPWTTDELAALAGRNIQPISSEKLARQSAERQLRPIIAARKKLVLFKPTQRDGEQLAEHPIWTRLQTAVKQANAKPVPVDTDNQLAHGPDGLTLNLDQLPAKPLPQLRRWLHLPDGLGIPQRERESFSSLKSFVHSPFEWVCQYTARLSAGKLANSRLAVDPRLKGQLVHRLVELMFPATGPTFAWEDSTEGDLDKWIDDHWTKLLRHEGALLLLPGYQSEASALRVMAKRTVSNLIEMLRRHDARNVIADHHPDRQPFGEGELRGDIDLCYETGKGEPVVMDLKFGGHDDREAEVRDNTSLQLAVYGYLMKQGNLDAPPKSAFYILTKRAWITGDGEFFNVRSVDPGDYGLPDMRECWDRFLDVWQWRRQQIDAGNLEITFTGTEPDVESTPPHDAWGPIENDGKYSDLVKLAGWKEEA